MLEQLEKQSSVEAVSVPTQPSNFLISGEKCVKAIFKLVVTIFSFENSQVEQV